MTAFPVDPDDYIWVGSGQPGAVDTTDARAGVGRLTPLPLKMDAFYAGVAVGFKMLPVSAAAVPLGMEFADALSATIQVQGAAIRWTVDGSTPTATNGFRNDAGAIITLTMRQTLQAFQAIREGGTDATLAVQLWA